MIDSIYSALKVTIAIVFIFINSIVGIASETKSGRERGFNNNWKFLVETSSIDANKSDFDDSRWRKLDLPHDWSIEDFPEPESADQIGPFSKKSIGGANTGYTVGGTAWYRKNYTFMFTAGSKTQLKLIDIKLNKNDTKRTTY